MSSNEVLYEGDPSCKHGYVNVKYGGLEGQKWSCDYAHCRRTEFTTSIREIDLMFPANAELRTNSGSCAPDTYTYLTDESGAVHPIFPPRTRKTLAEVIESGQNLGSQ